MTIPVQLHSIRKVLSSLRFTIIIIASLSAVFLLGLWIPQKSVLTPALFSQWKERAPSLVRVLEFLQFTDIYTSPVTIALWFFFFTNLTFVMMKRVPAVLKRIEPGHDRWEDPISGRGFPHKDAISLPRELPAEEILAFLRRKGFSLIGSSSRFYGVKNRFSPLATILFHLSFFLMLLGGVISIYTRFTGELILATGEPFHGELERYHVLRMPRAGSAPQSRFMVSDVTPVIEGKTATSLKVGLIDRSGKRHVAEINYPYKDDHTSFVVQDIGLSPLAVIYDAEGKAEGKEVDGAYVKLNILKDREDGFEMHGYRFRVRFFPDYAVTNGEEISRSDEMRNPVFRVVASKEGNVAASGTFRPGEAFRFDGYELVFREAPYWVKFLVVKEYGTEILYAGFALTAVSLIWRLIFYRREIVVSISESGQEKILHLAGKAEFYRALAEDEFRELTERIRKLAARWWKNESFSL